MANAAKNEPLPTLNIIGNETLVKGDIFSKGDFRVDGNIQGNFSTPLKLVVGPSGSIEGNVTCKDCEIFGKVKGNILAKENMILRESAQITGDIRVNRLSIEAGACFIGHCSMLSAEKTPEPNKEK